MAEQTVKLRFRNFTSDFDTLPKKEQVKRKYISTSLSTEKETASAPPIPLCNKSYCRTQIQSSKFEYTWEIKRFKSVLRSTDTLISPPFPETAQYRIKIKISKEPDFSKTLLTFYILTETAFTGSCDICSEPNGIINQSISGFISNNTLLCETTINSRTFVYNHITTVVIKLEVFHQFVSNIVNINYQPEISTLKAPKAKDSTLHDNTNSDTEMIKFLINDEPYSIPKNLLYATNSKCFKHLDTCIGDLQLNNEGIIVINDKTSTFKIMLSYIRTGLIPESYSKYEDLLTVADKYDVQHLKMICEHQLLKDISVSNAIKFLKLAISSKAKYLEKCAIKFIKFHINKIKCLPDFKNLSQNESDEIIALIEKSEISEQHQSFDASSLVKTLIY